MKKRFRTTKWSLILAAQDVDSEESTKALDDLCQIYWFPLYGFVRRRGYSREEAEDLTQSFFARLFEKEFMQYVDQTKGRFRSFLLTALSHFLSDDSDRARALKRGGRVQHVSLDIERAEDLLAEVTAMPLTPEEVYDRTWAQTVMAAALGDVRRDYARKEKAELLAALEGHVLSNAPERPYRAIANEFRLSESGVKSAVRRLRQQIGAAIRLRIAKTLEDPAEIDEEMKYLLSLV